MRAWAAGIAGAVATAALIGGVSWAVGASDPLYACVTTKSGAIRMVSAATNCNSRTETKLTWNVQGPQGPAGAVGAPGPQGPVGPAGSGPRAVLLDANGVSLGQILPWASGSDWPVWDGSTVKTYNRFGLTYAPVPYQVFFTTSNCVGLPYVASAIVAMPAGVPSVIAMPDPSAFDGMVFHEASSPGSGQVLTVLSYFDGTVGSCQSDGYGYTGEMFELVLGAKVERPAMPLTPAVQP